MKSGGHNFLALYGFVYTYGGLCWAVRRTNVENILFLQLIVLGRWDLGGSPDEARLVIQFDPCTEPPLWTPPRHQNCVTHTVAKIQGKDSDSVDDAKTRTKTSSRILNDSPSQTQLWQQSKPPLRPWNRPRFPKPKN